MTMASPSGGEGTATSGTGERRSMRLAARALVGGLGNGIPIPSPLASSHCMSAMVPCNNDHDNDGGGNNNCSNTTGTEEGLWRRQ